MSASTLRAKTPTHSATGEPLAEAYRRVRDFTRTLCEPLTVEDQVIQSMPDASPTRWHLAHTTWFFETFVLREAVPGFRPFHPDFNYLFNSYYNQVGDQFPRPRRGLLSRPTIAQVHEYRAYVDRHMQNLLENRPDISDALARTIETGLHHEQQHQELILTDLKHMLSCNPLFPCYRPPEQAPKSGGPPSLRWIGFESGLREIGHGGDGFCYDNEGPRHRVYLGDFEIASRLVTNGEYLRFIEDGAYRRPELWLSEGWAWVGAQGWAAPLYWHYRDDGWRVFTLGGLLPVDPADPVCHVSFFEADAYARWAGARLATEQEWETAAESAPIEGNFVESQRFHPAALPSGAEADSPRQMFGDVWEWTASPYVGYPGYRPPEGAIGEYNGKFMCNQMVLRGGSCATSRTHIRRTYRNFFPPPATWQFTGFRLAR